MLPQQKKGWRLNPGPTKYIDHEETESLNPASKWIGCSCFFTFLVSSGIMGFFHAL